MAGKRILDAAALFNASRSIAAKHVNLRTHQFEVYSKTSSLATTVRNQTERVTLTASAAVSLARRLNESGPAYSTTASGTQASEKKGRESSVPSRESVEGNRGSSATRDGFEDHFYNRSEDNSAVDPVPDHDLGVRQEQPKRYPLADGTIPPDTAEDGVRRAHEDVYNTRPTAEPVKQPLEHERGGIQPNSSARSSTPTPFASSKMLEPEEAKRLQRQAEFQIPAKSAEPPPASAKDLNAPVDEYGEELGVDQEQDVFYRPSPNAPPVLSALPRVKIPRTTINLQEGDEHLPEDRTNPDVFYHSDGTLSKKGLPSAQAVPEQDDPTEDIMKDLFHSPKVASLLNSKRRGRSGDGDFKLTGAGKTPIDQTGLNKGKDQDTFNVRVSSQTSPEKPDQVLDGVDGGSSEGAYEDIQKLAANVAKEATGQKPDEGVALGARSEGTPFQMQESRVPSSRFGRLWQYGGLATSMAFGAVGEGFRRVTGSNEANGGSLMLSAGNMERLVAKLSRMRGASLKLGQMMSFQDSKMLPAPIHQVLQRVQDSADYMPASQRNKVLSDNLGPNWRDLFQSFEELPMAAASIGQVHGAVLKSTGQRVAVKVQYPGVANSIDSDLNNLSLLLTASRLLPKGLYLDKTIANARTELAWECDYIREAECARRFRDLLKDETDVFSVPAIIDEASGKQVLTMERMEGVAVTKIHDFTQEQKDWIGTQILRLCLREITEFKYMQTDPNWTNFLFDAKTQKLELLDFGASREYPDKFILPYVQILQAASRNDRDSCRELSIQLGYLTGHESQTMVNAHVSSVLTLAEPFMDSSDDVYDFRDQTITDRVRGLIPVMVRERLSPPPEETYSLHRKLSGAFLLCARLGSRVRCKELFAKAVQHTAFS